MLISIYYAHMSWQLQRIQETEDVEEPLRKGSICKCHLRSAITLSLIFPLDFTRYNHSHLKEDITDPDFWDVDYRWMTTAPSAQGIRFPGNSGLPDGLREVGDTLRLSNLASFGTYPNVWMTADGLAKSFYSTILADLGQTDNSSNIVLNTTALEYYTRNFTYMAEHVANAKPGPANTTYNGLNGPAGHLNTFESYIATTYLCQTPKLKSIGSIIVSVLVADLVFMQALWKLFAFITTTWLSRKQPQGETSYPFMSA